MRKWLCIILLFPLFVSAGYNRNVARPVNEVVFGYVDTVRYISQQEVTQSKANGWHTLLGAVIGGLVGNQFGGGHGKEVATVAGTVIGAGVVRNQQQGNVNVREYKLVELLIKTDDGRLINVIQDVDSNMRFDKSDKVRILYFDDGVRVDKNY